MEAVVRDLGHGWWLLLGSVVAEESAPLAPIIPRDIRLRPGGPKNEKTPRGCERSARGSGARRPLSCGSFPRQTVTADRRACCQ
ncbi:hypothetical protein FM076_24250 [Streptomyces albus subsp. chlorinus]|nr:hypothetical protein [Streptomyces albus subsp. chlorinus]